MTADIEVTRDGAVQIIRFTRPAKKNAISGPMYRAMIDALIKGDADAGVAAHVFLGSGGVFSAGNDIADFLAISKGHATAHGVSDVLKFIAMLPQIAKPVIAGVGGLASGIAVTMLFHCDLVYAAPNATFATPFLNLGLVPEAGSSLLAPRLMGPQRAFELLVMGEPFSAERAREAGLVNAIIPADTLDDHALEAARRLARKPPEALAISRRLLRGDPADIKKRIDEEAALFLKRLTSAEAVEAFTAFFEKRPPNFSTGGAEG